MSGLNTRQSNNPTRPIHASAEGCLGLTLTHRLQRYLTIARNMPSSCNPSTLAMIPAQLPPSPSIHRSISRRPGAATRLCADASFHTVMHAAAFVYLPQSIGTSAAQHQVAPTTPCSVGRSVHQQLSHATDILGHPENSARARQHDFIRGCSAYLSRIVSSAPSIHFPNSPGCSGLACCNMHCRLKINVLGVDVSTTRLRDRSRLQLHEQVCSHPDPVLRSWPQPPRAYR